MAPVPSTFHIPYSQKNIPTIPKFQFQKMLIKRIEEVLCRMRWKLFWSKIQEKDKLSKNFFGFKSCNYPPSMPELKPFEEDLISIVSSLEMKLHNNPLQEKMKEDMDRIRQTKEMIVPADKTTNLYRIPTEQYRNFLKKNIESEYKKVTETKVEKINVEAATIANNLEIDDRVEALAMKTSFLSLKDHKPDFPSKLNFRLINPTKTNIGQISKQILDRINGDIRATSMVNQWRSTKEVLYWFNNIERKQQKRWLKFDVEAFYPSISKNLLKKAINYARTITTVTQEEEDIIYHCRRSILVGPDKTLWQKVSNPEFDVTMGSRDGAEICELVGLFMLKQLENIMPKEDMGLYRDDGLCLVEGGGPAVERMKKKITQLFKAQNLKITTEGNTKVVDFLDVVMDLSTGTHKPFIKPNAVIRYVSSMSSHPPSILKNLPDNISKRLSTISSGEEEFKEEADRYHHALIEAGYKDKLTYQQEDREHQVVSTRKPRHRQIIWFNPPWASNIKTNVAGRFISLIKKHFPPNSPLYKLFNTKKVKVSYSTCPNMEFYIKAHNSKLMKEEMNMPEPGCNCRGGVTKCPLQGRCQIPALVYKAKTLSGDETKEYIGQTAITFKLRFNNHTASFANISKKNNTTLSHYFWKRKLLGEDTSITWKPVSITNPYKRGGQTCSLCLTEKVSIARGEPNLMLNKRSEIMKKCRHRLPHMLNNFLSTCQPQPDPPDQVNKEPIAHPAPDPIDDQPIGLTHQPAASTPGPPDDQPADLPEQVAAVPSVVLDEDPKPQRKSCRRKKLVSYKL